VRQHHAADQHGAWCLLRRLRLRPHPDDAELHQRRGRNHERSADRKVKRIVTARRFIELAKLDALVATLNGAELIYLEDVRENLSIFDKAVAGIGQFMPPLSLAACV